MKQGPKIRDCKLIIGLFLPVFFVCLLLSGAVPSEKETSNIKNTRLVIEKWVQTQGIISKEKRDFELAKEMLNENIELVQREINSLRGKIGEAEESIAEADKKRAEMIEENEKLKEASASLDSVLISLEEGTKQLLVRLPAPIRDRVKPLSQQIPENVEATKLSMSQRFQNVVGILNEIDKFNREISANSEVRELANGSSVEVTALYIGIGQGYYASADKKVAGIGTASEKGWTWRQANEAAEQISDAIAILNNEKVACFVQLPVKIE